MLTCKRCEQDFAEYWVTSLDDEGKKLLDMPVCKDCAWEAQRVGLNVSSVPLKQGG